METSAKPIVIVTGPESTGKTTIARALAARYNGTFVPEFARNYIINLKRNYTYDDICLIAKKQYEQYCTTLSQSSSKICFFDTYLIITKIWMIWHASRYETWVDDAIGQTRQALWLICAPDIEWEADPVRENGGEARIKLYEQYIAELEKFKLNFKIVTGSEDARIHHAESFVETYINRL